jgi:hypothetical protein
MPRRAFDRLRIGSKRRAQVRNVQQKKILPTDAGFADIHPNKAIMRKRLIL